MLEFNLWVFIVFLSPSANLFSLKSAEQIISFYHIITKVYHFKFYP